MIVYNNENKKFQYIPIDKEVKKIYKERKKLLKTSYCDFKNTHDSLSPIKKCIKPKDYVINHCKLWMFMGNYFLNNPSYVKSLNDIKKRFFSYFNYSEKPAFYCFLCEYAQYKQNQIKKCEKCLVHWRVLNKDIDLSPCNNSYYRYFHFPYALNNKKTAILCYQIAFLGLQSKYNVTMKDVFKIYK